MSNNPIFQFEDAVRVQCKASIMIEGLSGSGKSGLALAIAEVLADGDWSKVFDIDTENNSVRLFSGIGNSNGGSFGTFKVGNLTKDIGFSPSNFLAFRNAAVNNGAKVVIEDSISHAWMYQGGVLDKVSNVQSTLRNPKDSYAAWGDAEVRAEKNKLLELIRDDRVHVITTVRVKEKQELSYNSDGKLEIKSLGEQQIQQADLKYEPDLVLQMVSPGYRSDSKVVYPKAKVIKTRYAIFEVGEIYEFTKDLILQLKEYLEEGVDPNELLQKQKDEYISAVKDYLDTHPNIVTIWKELKKNAGYENTKLPDIPLSDLKELFVTLTT